MIGPAPTPAAARLTLAGPISPTPDRRRPSPCPLRPEPADTAPPGDLPVTLVVELGRLSLPLARLADLKAGDVVELGRDALHPVDLTSGGTLVARGELVQIDAELGVKLTRIYL